MQEKEQTRRRTRSVTAPVLPPVALLSQEPHRVSSGAGAAADSVVGGDEPRGHDAINHG